jgi:hypothetical protein
VTITPDADRQARRDALLHLTHRMLSGALLPSERDLLATHVEEALRDGDQAREQLAAARAGDAPWIKAYGEDIEQARRGEAEAVRARQAAEEGERRAMEQRQEMAAERYAWQERGDRAEKRAATAERDAKIYRDRLDRLGEGYTEQRRRAEGAKSEARRNRDAWRNARRRARELATLYDVRQQETNGWHARAERAERAANLLADAERNRQAAEATLTAVRKAVAACKDRLATGYGYYQAITAALGDPQPATEAEVLAAACGPEAQWDATQPEPECQDAQGCHRVVPCNPGCAVTSRALADALSKAQQQPTAPEAHVHVTPQQVADAVRRVFREDHAHLRDLLR